MKSPATLAEFRDRQGLIGRRCREKLRKEIGANVTIWVVRPENFSETPVGIFLLREFKINYRNLTKIQKAKLEQDIAHLSWENRTALRDIAKRDGKTVKKLLNTLDKLQLKLQGLSPDFWSQKGQKVECHPAFSLQELRENLETHQFLVEQESDILGKSKQNVERRALCLRAIDIFLRWHIDDRPKRKRGITYPNNVSQLLKISKSVGRVKSADATSELATFLENCTVELGKEHKHWDFSYWEPGREAKAIFMTDKLPDILTD